MSIHVVASIVCHLGFATRKVLIIAGVGITKVHPCTNTIHDIIDSNHAGVSSCVFRLGQKSQ